MSSSQTKCSLWSNGPHIFMKNWFLSILGRGFFPFFLNTGTSLNNNAWYVGKVTMFQTWKVFILLQGINGGVTMGTPCPSLEIRQRCRSLLGIFHDRSSLGRPSYNRSGMIPIYLI